MIGKQSRFHGGSPQQLDFRCLAYAIYVSLAPIIGAGRTGLQLTCMFYNDCETKQVPRCPPHPAARYAPLLGAVLPKVVLLGSIFRLLYS